LRKSRGLPLLGPRKRHETIPLTIHWPECIDIWYETTLVQGDSSVRVNKVPGVITGPAPMGHSFVVLSLNNKNFSNFLHLIYPVELAVKDLTRLPTLTFTSNMTLMDGTLTTKLYDKRDDFRFPTVNYPFLDSNILSSAYGVYMSQLIRYSRTCNS